MSVTIRPARLSDVNPLAALSGQLGYPNSEGEIASRLEALAARGDNAVFVAEDAGVVVAWIGVRGDLSLETGPYAEIVGLVVDEAHRGRGTGEALVRVAESWARDRGHSRIRVRSNVKRERAHRFYERLGYSGTKNQRVFDKILP